MMGHRAKSIASSSSSPSQMSPCPRIPSSHPSGAPAKADAWNTGPSSVRSDSIDERARTMTGWEQMMPASTRSDGSLRIMLLRSSTSSPDSSSKSTWEKSSRRIRCHASPLQERLPCKSLMTRVRTKYLLVGHNDVRCRLQHGHTKTTHKSM